MNIRQVSSSGDLRDRVANVVMDIRKIHDEIQKNCLFLLNGSASIITKMQATSSVNVQDPTNQLIYNTIIEHCTRAERIGPGSFSSTLQIILGALERKTLNVSQKNFQEVVGASYAPTLRQLNEFLIQSIDDEFLSALVLETINLTGLEGKIFFEKSNNDVVSIEKINGYNFSVKFPFSVNLKTKNAKIVIIDGFVESIGEINHLLVKSSETKETVLVVTRGMSDDVLNTLKVNWDRKTLNVIPVTVQFDFDGVNTLADLATVCQTDVVSSAQGQLMTSIKYDDIVYVPFVSCSGNTLTIVNDQAIKATQLQVSKLLKKRSEAKIEDLARLFDTRIKSLTPSCTKVRIPNGKRYAENLEKFDTALRLVRSTIVRGLVKSDSLPTNEIFSHFPKMMTVEGALASLKFSQACFKMLNDSNVIIT